MKFRTRVMATATALSGAALAMVPMVGQAQVPEVPSDAIVFVGVAGTTSDGTACPGPFVCIAGGGGSYSFASIVAACYSDMEGIALPEVTVSTISPCSIASAGSFTNVVCGTGHASGSATLVGEPEGASTASFGITFVATVGLVGINTVTQNDTSTLNSSDGSIEPLVGVVLLTVPPPGAIPSPTANQCSPGFTVIGAAVAYALSGS